MTINADHTDEAQPSPKEQPSEGTDLDEESPSEEVARAAKIKDNEELSEEQLSADEQEDEHNHKFNGVCCHHESKLSERCPRTFWFCGGIMFPLWCLISISSLFGWGLATLEAPNEIVLNNKRLRNTHLLRAVENSTREIISIAPTVCLRLYLEQTEKTNNSTGGTSSNITFTNNSTTNVNISEPLSFNDIFGKSRESYVELAATVDAANELLNKYNDDDDAPLELITNLTDAFLFMNECGRRISSMVDELNTPTASLVLGNATDVDFGDLTFNWNRCANGTNTTISIPWFGERTYTSFHPEAQAEFFEDTWHDDMERLYYERINDTLPENSTREDRITSTVLALQYATQHATGQPACVINVPAGCWFFFTVMTTIGYGNQAPETPEGQAMLYTLGFVSILLFAGVALRAGNITTSLFEDIMGKVHLTWLNHALLAAIFWGVLYYLWLFFIALLVRDWKKKRMDEELGFDESYWFGYISTTTVGLGDYYLEPEVIVSEDLLIFSFVFLIGFVFSASFLDKLSSLVKQNDHVGLAHLKENLANTIICCGKEVIGASRRLGSSVVFLGQALGASGPPPEETQNGCRTVVANTDADGTAQSLMVGNVPR